MKLIIDIPKELYEDIKYNFDKQNYCECGGYLISSKIVFGIPLEEEGYITTIERRKEDMPCYPFD